MEIFNNKITDKISVNFKLYLFYNFRYRNLRIIFLSYYISRIFKFFQFDPYFFDFVFPFIQSRHHGGEKIIIIIIMIHFANFQIFPIRSILLWFRFPFYTISRHGEIIIIIIIMIDRTKEISFPFLNIEIYQSYLYPTIFHKFSNFLNSKFRSILFWLCFLFPISRRGIIIIIMIRMIGRTKEISFPLLNIEIYESYPYPSTFHKFSNFSNSKFWSILLLFPLLSNIETP